jgi:hypothetical protein
LQLGRAPDQCASARLGQGQQSKRPFVRKPLIGPARTLALDFHFGKERHLFELACPLPGSLFNLAICDDSEQGLYGGSRLIKRRLREGWMPLDRLS